MTQKQKHLQAYEYLIEDKAGYREGVCVRLWDYQKMDDGHNTDFLYLNGYSREEVNNYEKHRIWMTDEYIVLTPEQVSKLKEQWNG